MLKNAYYYLFYKFYKFGEWSPSIFPSDFTATFSIAQLEVLILISLKFYYIEFWDINDTFVFYSIQTIFPLLAVFFLNYFAFISNNKWKTYVKKFDKLPERKDLLGTWMVIGLVALIIGNLTLAFSIMGRMTGID